MKPTLILSVILAFFAHTAKADSSQSESSSSQLPKLQILNLDKLKLGQVKSSKKVKNSNWVESDVEEDISIGLKPIKMCKIKTAEALQEQDYERLNKELEVLK